MLKSIISVIILSQAIVASVGAQSSKDASVIDIESAVGSVKVGTDGVSIKGSGVGKVNINTRGTDPSKVCIANQLPQVVIHVKASVLNVNANSVQAQATDAIKRSGLKSNVSQTPVAVCLISDSAELKADLSRLNLARLDIHSAAGIVKTTLPAAGTPQGKLFTDTGSITVWAPSTMGATLSSSKAGYGAISLDRRVARQGDKTHRANFTATTSAGSINILPVGASDQDVGADSEVAEDNVDAE